LAAANLSGREKGSILANDLESFRPTESNRRGTGWEPEQLDGFVATVGVKIERGTVAGLNFAVWLL
jgi:hypothetical protein